MHGNPYSGVLLIYFDMSDFEIPAFRGDLLVLPWKRIQLSCNFWVS